MAVHHHPHLLDFSTPPPNTVVTMEAPPPASSFDHGHLLALHVDGTDDMSAAAAVPHHHRALLAHDDTPAWPHQAAVSLSLYNYDTAAGGSSSSSLFGGHHHQQEQEFAMPPPAAVSLLSPNNNHHHHLPTSSMEPPFQLRSSRYLGPVQELLSEFCSLEGDCLHAAMNKQRAPGAAAAGRWHWHDDVEPSSSSSSSALWGHPSSLSSMDLLELERRKTRLLSMVEEVDRRYRRYREQIGAVEEWLEAAAGAGAAQVYTRLALRAMSRHFRCLRDALVAQVRPLRKAMGDGGGAAAAAAAGATKGETPRLKVVDQCLRQQRALFQHPGSIDNNYPWRPQRGLPERAVAVLRAWLFDHFLHPYPNDVDKHILARQTGLSRSQVSNWFINARVRLWKPMIEDMYTDEVKQQSEAPPHQNPSTGGGGSGARVVKPEQQNYTGENHFRTSAGTGNPISSSMISSSIVTDSGDDHLFSSYPSSIHGGHGTVSLTLGLEHQQQPFASPTMHQGSSLMSSLQGEEEDPVLPYI